MSWEIPTVSSQAHNILKWAALSLTMFYIIEVIVQMKSAQINRKNRVRPRDPEGKTRSPRPPLQGRIHLQDGRGVGTPVQPLSPGQEALVVRVSIGLKITPFIVFEKYPPSGF